MPQVPQHERIVRFAVALILIAVLFFAIEILPLHYGAKAIPWDQLGLHIRRRLPRMIVIAVLAAAYIGFGSRTQQQNDNVGKNED